MRTEPQFSQTFIAKVMVLMRTAARFSQKTFFKNHPSVVDTCLPFKLDFRDDFCDNFPDIPESDKHCDSHNGIGNWHTKWSQKV